MMAGISGSLYGMVWIDVETNPSSGCSWSGHDAASNCQFVTDIVNRIKSKGKTPGIYATAYMWQTIFGGRNACPGVASQQLWYAHYDGSPSFSDFGSFGGWSKPAIKQYQGDTTLCGAGVDKNFYPWSPILTIISSVLLNEPTNTIQIISRNWKLTHFFSILFRFGLSPAFSTGSPLCARIQLPLSCSARSTGF